MKPTSPSSSPAPLAPAPQDTGIENKSKPSRPVFFRRTDIAVILVVLAVAAGLFFFFQQRPTGAMAEVSVGVDSQRTAFTVPLNKDEIIEVNGAPFPVTLEVKDGAIRFINSQCPDHKCEEFGWLRHEGDWALCAPAAVMVRVTEEG